MVIHMNGHWRLTALIVELAEGAITLTAANQVVVTTTMQTYTSGYGASRLSLYIK